MVDEKVQGKFLLENILSSYYSSEHKYNFLLSKSKINQL